MEIIYFIAVLIYIGVNGFLASTASDVAEDKGYSKRKFFHMCFWLAPIPYIIVAALPDMRMRAQNEQLIGLQTKMLEKLDGVIEPASEKNSNSSGHVSFSDLPQL